MCRETRLTCPIRIFLTCINILRADRPPRPLVRSVSVSTMCGSIVPKQLPGLDMEEALGNPRNVVDRNVPLRSFDGTPVRGNKVPLAWWREHWPENARRHGSHACCHEGRPPPLARKVE